MTRVFFSSAYRLITVIVNVMMVLSGIYGPRSHVKLQQQNYALLYEDLKRLHIYQWVCFYRCFSFSFFSKVRFLAYSVQTSERSTLAFKSWQPGS